MSDLTEAMRGSKNFLDFFRTKKYVRNFYKENPDYFKPEGIIVFSAFQGQGKTLSSTSFVRNLTWLYPKAILCTNTDIEGLNPLTKVVEYEGMESLMDLNNGLNGVIYFIDEIELEFNCLESKNIPARAIREFAQARKQRKLIVGTSQFFLRVAKPLREQTKYVVFCRKLFNCLQYNVLCNGMTLNEENGKVKMDILKKFIWFHTPELYDSYDTFAKMKRYRKDWC